MKIDIIITLIDIAVMAVLALCLFICMIRNAVTLREIRIKQKDISEEKNHSMKVEIKSGEAYSYELAEIRYDKKRFVEVLNDFERVYSRYVLVSQLISLFPLLGILGTVGGLIVGMHNNSDVNNMLSGLDTAMITTAVGLILSILFKLFDAIIGKKINIVDSRFEIIRDGMEWDQFHKEVAASSTISEPKQEE